jgi:hypothetical protein
MVAHICNPSYLRGGDQEDHVQGEPEQNISETTSQEINWCGGSHL